MPDLVRRSPTVETTEEDIPVEESGKDEDVQEQEQHSMKTRQRQMNKQRE